MNNDGYIAYRCKSCGLVFVVPEDSIRLAGVLQRFMSCPLGHRGIEELDRYDDMLECMNQKYSSLT